MSNDTAPLPEDVGRDNLAPDARPTTVRDRLRPGTVVWGIVVAVAGSAVVAWGQGLRFDVQLAAIGVLAAAGAVLVATAFARSREG